MTRAWLLPLLIALSTGAAAAATPVRAEQSEQRRPLFVRLTPTVEELSRARTAALEQRLAELLSTWPGIHHVQVHLTLPVAAEQPLDRPLPPARATVILTRAVEAGGFAPAQGAQPPPPEVVLTLLRSVVPTLEPEHLTLLEQSAPVASAPRLEPTAAARHASSTTLATLRTGLALSLVCNAVLAMILLSRLRRHRPAAQKVDPPARLPSPP